MEELILRPQPISRFACAIASIAALPLIGVCSAAVEAVAGTSTAGTLVMVVLTLVILTGAVVIAVRGYQLAVICRPHEIEIRGYLRTLRIPLAEIAAVYVHDGEVFWQAPGREPRPVSIMAFKTGYRTAPSVRRHQEESMMRLREWWKAHR
jgi:hypothetical protein